MSELFPFKTTALKVDQRLGTFYVVILPAELLLEVAFSDTLRATLNTDGNGYKLEGTQRMVQDKRLDVIADYINRVDSTFPNSIIIATNHDQRSGLNIGENEYITSETNDISSMWSIDKKDDGSFELKIPSNKKLAAIIDGQHRLFSFARANPKAMKDMNLLCSVFIDLPKAYQAQIFATINSTQKSVNRSQTFELFGYNISEEEERYWTPDKLAVYFTRKLGTNDNSPLKGKIIVAPKNDPSLEKLSNEAEWQVSTSVIVDGILRLFSNNPNRDANLMKKDHFTTRKILSSGSSDNSPLRQFYIKGNDKLIYQMVLNYLKAIEELFWMDQNPNSFIFRTVGIQALFDVLRKISKKSIEDYNISVNYFTNILDGAKNINFADEIYRIPSATGRTKIRKAIEEKISP